MAKRAVALHVFVLLVTSTTSFVTGVGADHTSEGFCHLIDSGDPVPQPYGVPWDVLSPEKKLFIKVSCGSAQADAKVRGSGPRFQVLYKQGYVLYPDSTTWRPFSLSGQPYTVQGTSYPDWIDIGSNSTGSPLTADISFFTSFNDLENISNVAFYICTWVEGKWKCGCRHEFCAKGNWQLQKFSKRDDIRTCQEIFFDLDGSCELVNKLRYENYFNISYDRISDDQLRSYVKRNKAVIQGDLSRIDYGWEIHHFLNRRLTSLGHEEEFFQLLFDKAIGLDLWLETIVEILSRRGDSLTLGVLSKTLKVLSLIKEGKDIYKQLFGAITFFNTREMLQIYFQGRCGGSQPPVCSEHLGSSKDNVWPSIMEDFKPLLELISRERRVPLEKLDEWFESAFIVYRSVGYNDSLRIRSAEGLAIADLAS